MHLCARPSTYHLHRTRDCHRKKRASGPRGPKPIHARSSNEPTAPQWSPSARIRKLLSYLTLLVEGAGNWSAHPTWSEAKAEDAQRTSASRVADQADRISWFFEGGICFFSGWLLQLHHRDLHRLELALIHNLVVLQVADSGVRHEVEVPFEDRSSRRKAE